MLKTLEMFFVIIICSKEMTVIYHLLDIYICRNIYIDVKQAVVHVQRIRFLPHNLNQIEILNLTVILQHFDSNLLLLLRIIILLHYQATTRL